MVNGVQEHAHVAQDERAELAPLRRFGREPRIDVLLRFRDRPLSLDDQADHAQALFLAKDIAKKIETELEYPGQIKVNVIREFRSVEYAK